MRNRVEGGVRRDLELSGKVYLSMDEEPPADIAADS